MSGIAVTVVEANGLGVTNTTDAMPVAWTDAPGLPITLMEAGGIPVTLVGEDGQLFIPKAAFVGGPYTVEQAEAVYIQFRNMTVGETWAFEISGDVDGSESDTGTAEKINFRVGPYDLSDFPAPETLNLEASQDAVMIQGDTSQILEPEE